MADSEETERSESSERTGQDEETKASIAELMENMWTAVETGKDKELRKFFSKNEERDIPLNRDNEEFDEDGGHILIFCVKEGCSRGNSFGRDFVQCFRILLNNDNLDIDVQDKSERTALHWAVLGKNTQFTSLLMKAGADPTIHDHDGLSPFHIAVQKGYKELLKILASNQDKEVTLLIWFKPKYKLNFKVQRGSNNLAQHTIGRHSNPLLAQEVYLVSKVLY